MEVPVINRLPLSGISSNVFDFKTRCVLCARSLKDTKHSGKCHASGKLKGVLSELIGERSDSWAKDVKRRVLGLNNLEDVGARYHRGCMENFRKKRPKPPGGSRSRTLTTPSRKRELDRSRIDAFLKVTENLKTSPLAENGCEGVSVENLRHDMNRELRGTGKRAFSHKVMVKRLKTDCRDDLVVSQGIIPSTVWHRGSVSKAVRQQQEEKDSTAVSTTSVEEERNQLVQKLAKIIVRETEELQQTYSTEYPRPCTLSSLEEQTKFVPPTLSALLQALWKCSETKTQVRMAAIGQAITQLMLPRKYFSPLMWGIGCKIQHEIRSKGLLEFLQSLGFSISYAEVLKYYVSAALSGATAVLDEEGGRVYFIKYVADNVDHNKGSIDGADSVHAMGMMGASWPASDKTSKRVIKRAQVSLEELKKVGTVPIRFYSSRNDSFSKMKIEDVFLSSIHCEEYEQHSFAEILWKTAYYFRHPTPMWRGLMQMICNKGHHPGPSSKIFLPIIDLNPNDETCVYSTLHFIVAHANKLSVPPVLTFDQPLFWKAFSIIENELPNSVLKKVVLLLGGFHTKMSFISAIGYIYKGSGLFEALEKIFPRNTVRQILGGKAVARAERAHTLVEAALNILIMEEAYPSGDQNDESDPSLHQDEAYVSDEQNKKSDPFVHQDIRDLSVMLEILLQKPSDCPSSENLDPSDSPTLIKVEERLNAVRHEICHRSRTGQFWFQYLDLVKILRNHRKAEYTGDWLLHMKTLKDMIPIFAASGHNNYLKTACIYIQKMQKLEEQHPRVFEMFMEGHHVIRRVDQFWGGISCDLFIEQELMKPIKSRGGLTRGGGMTESQRLTWLLARPIGCDISSNLDSLVGRRSEMERQNTDASPARMKRDTKDVQELVNFFRSAGVFSRTDSLRSLATGREALPNVNADSAFVVGRNIVESIFGQSVGEIHLSKKDLVITMDTDDVVSVGNTKFSIEPAALFQRLITVCQGSTDFDFPGLFKYELSTLPAALFGKDGLMREPSKCQMKNALLAMGGAFSTNLSEVQSFIFDGGSLLHAKKWPKHTTYKQLFEMYISYVKEVSSGEQVCVVFDGYTDGPSTKDEAHMRRYGGTAATSSFDFSANMTVALKQDVFLSNPLNKKRFISMLSVHMNAAGIETFTAPGDADYYVAMKAIESAARYKTAVIAEDTDILVLLLHHVAPSSKDLLITGNSGKCKKEQIVNINKMRSNLGDTLCTGLPFLHAFLGCDTTSRVYGIGRRDILEKFKKTGEFQEMSNIFLDSTATKDEISSAAKTAFALTYGGRKGESLGEIRYHKFVRKVATSVKAVQPKMLPPSEDAAIYHALRVYLQVQTWRGNNDLLPTDWGWTLRAGKYVATKLSAEAVAPPELLLLMRCNCKGDCSTLRCSCKKNNMVCTSACGQCRGTDCSNSLGPADSTETNRSENEESSRSTNRNGDLDFASFNGDVNANAEGQHPTSTFAETEDYRI